MSEKEYQRIFSKNLKNLMYINNKTQADLINDLGFNKSAVSTWVNGTRLPRMDKVDILAKYFGVLRSALIEDIASPSQAVDQLSLTPDIQKLLSDYGKLNEKGKEKAREYTSDLTEQPKYTEKEKEMRSLA